MLTNLKQFKLRRNSCQFLHEKEAGEAIFSDHQFTLPAPAQSCRSGPVVGGLVGTSRLAYDYWGDPMNIASRIEGAAEPNGIAVSAATDHQCTGAHDFDPSEIIALKDVGDIVIYRTKPALAH